LYFCASFCVSVCTFGAHTHSSVILDKRLAFFLLGLGEIWDAFAHFSKRNRHLCIHIGVFEDLNGWYSVYLLYWYKTTDTEKFERPNLLVHELRGLLADFALYYVTRRLQIATFR